MSKLVVKWDEETPEWVILDFPRNDTYVSMVKAIRPFSYRKWTGKHWEVHIEKLIIAVKLGQRVFEAVDWSGLPPQLQIALVQGLKTPNTGAIPTTERLDGLDPHSVLYLRQNAPYGLVKVAYKYLAMETHPDRGGNEAEFKKIKKAFEAIKETKDQKHGHSRRSATNGARTRGP